MLLLNNNKTINRLWCHLVSQIICDNLHITNLLIPYYVHQIDWLAILKGYYGQDINGQTKLYVRNLPYFDMIEEMLRNETTNKNR